MKHVLLLLIMTTVSCSSPSSGLDDCPIAPQFPDSDEISSTPRSSTEAEFLALRCSSGWVADQELYETIVADLVSIRGADPAMADIRDHRLNDAVRDILVEPVDAAASQRLEAGEEPEFECLMALVDGSFTTLDNLEFGLVTTPGLFYAPGLAALIATTPDVQQAEPNGSVGDGPTIAYDVRREPRLYLFDDAGGDCPSGCTTHHYLLWEVYDQASPALVAEWGNDDETEIGEMPSDFSFDDFECRRCEDGSSVQDVDEDCTDGVDNDCDGDTDCDDRTCADQTVCQPEVCDNEVDDNDDGQTDCEDPQCDFSAACGTPSCGSDTDRAFIDERQQDRGLSAFLLRDALACDQEAEQDAQRTVALCMASTLTTNGVSNPCAVCLAGYGECAMSVCRDECHPDFDQQPCADCMTSSCEPTIDDCLGEPFAEL